jgi:hypothetical protein
MKVQTPPPGIGHGNLERPVSPLKIPGGMSIQAPPGFEDYSALLCHSIHDSSLAFFGCSDDQPLHVKSSLTYLDRVVGPDEDHAYPPGDYAEECGEQPRTPRQPFDRKEHKRLRQKLCEIAKIEERVAAGDKIDPLQRMKLDRKSDVVAEFAMAQKCKCEERAQQEATKCQLHDGSNTVKPFVEGAFEQEAAVLVEHDQMWPVNMDDFSMPWTEFGMTQMDETTSLIGAESTYEFPTGVYSLIEQVASDRLRREAHQLRSQRR